MCLCVEGRVEKQGQPEGEEKSRQNAKLKKRLIQNLKKEIIVKLNILL